MSTTKESRWHACMHVFKIRIRKSEELCVIIMRLPLESQVQCSLFKCSHWFHNVSRNFWEGRNWAFEHVCLQASPTAICKLARFLKLWTTLTTSVLLPIKDRSAGHRLCWWHSSCCFRRKMAARQHTRASPAHKLESALGASWAKRGLTVILERLLDVHEYHFDEKLCFLVTKINAFFPGKQLVLERSLP